jgi:hypothetical protein
MMTENESYDSDKEYKSSDDDAVDLAVSASEIEESDDDVLCLVKDSRKASEKHLAEWMTEARGCYDMVAGHQWSDEDKAVLEEMNRPAVVFNRIGPVVDSVSGTEINNRQQVQYLPRQVGDAGVNELLTGAAKWVRDNCDAEDEESDAFFDLVVCGLGWTETRLDYTDDPDGMVIIDRIDPLSMRYDPAAKKRNLVDKRWVQREEWLEECEIEARWPDKEIDNIAGVGGAPETSTPHDATNAWLYKNDATGYDPTSGKYLVTCHQWYTLETYHRVLDPFTGQITELDHEAFERLETMLKAKGINLESAKLQRKVYKQAFVCGGTVLEKGLAPSQKDFTFNALTGKRDRNKNVWYGLVRSMTDPQRWANKFFSQILHIINGNAKGGLMIEDGAVDNIRKLEDAWAQADSITVFSDGALSQGKVQPKPQAPVPVGPERMMEFSISSIRDSSGVNLEQLGMANRQQAGYLEAQRKQSGLTILAVMFDSMRRYRKNQGRLLADFIQNYLSDGRLIRITGQDGSERYIPLLRQNDTMQYDVIVDEAPTSHNVKERVFGMMMQMLPVLTNAGVPMPPEIVDYMPLPSRLTEKWRAQIVERQNNPAQAQAQQMQAQIQQAGAAADIREKNAAAALKEAQAQTTVAGFAGEARNINADAQLKEMKAQNEALSAELKKLQARLGIAAPSWQ